MELKVYVYRRPNMFLVNENLYHMIGVGELENLFTIENYKTDHEELKLYFPERFLNILEKRALIERIKNAGYKKVTIVTHCEHILTTVKHTNILIVQDDLIQENSQFKLSNDDVGMPDCSNLGVLNSL